jgi:hypothetical protein
VLNSAGVPGPGRSAAIDAREASFIHHVGDDKYAAYDEHQKKYVVGFQGWPHVKEVAMDELCIGPPSASRLTRGVAATFCGLAKQRAHGQ